MIPFRTLAQTRTPDGALLALHEHDGAFFLKLNGRQLMSTAAVASELLLGDLACAADGSQNGSGGEKRRILVGGLGLGFTLKRVLERAGPSAAVHVAELLPEVVAWNREFLASLNGALLDDPRVSVFTEDVFKVLARSAAAALRYDAILLDVDNGPVAMVQGQNARLYERHGFRLVAAALNKGGRAAFWSADEDRPFCERLARAGFHVETFESKAHERAKRAAHRIYVATPK